LRVVNELDPKQKLWRSMTSYLRMEIDRKLANRFSVAQCHVFLITNYPVYLWENSGDDPTFGRVNGRKAISSTQLPAGQVIFAKWSELIIANWVGIEILVDPYSLATTAEIRVRASLLADIQFRYPLAFCASSDSGAQ